MNILYFPSFLLHLLHVLFIPVGCWIKLNNFHLFPLIIHHPLIFSFFSFILSFLFFISLCIYLYLYSSFLILLVQQLCLWPPSTHCAGLRRLRWWNTLSPSLLQESEYGSTTHAQPCLLSPLHCPLSDGSHQALSRRTKKKKRKKEKKKKRKEKDKWMDKRMKREMKWKDCYGCMEWRQKIKWECKRCIRERIVH